MVPISPTHLEDLVHEVIEQDLPPIVIAGHPALRQPALEYSGQLNAACLQKLVDTMRNVMRAAPGVGLAAPQLGIPLRIAVLEDGVELPAAVAAERERTPLASFAVLNPSYTAVGSATANFYEGCLSVPGYQAAVERAHTISFAYTSPAGLAVDRHLSGWSARIAQHETDHLNGTLYLDRAQPRSLAHNREYAARWAQPGIAEARKALDF